MAVAIGDIVRINAIVTMTAQQFENVHHFEVIANGSADDTAFMVAVQLAIAPVYANAQNQQSDLLVYQRIEGQNLTQSILLPTTNWAGNPNGDKLFDPLPTQNSANVFWPTNRPKTRCTTYIPGFTEDANNATGQWDIDAKTDLQAFGDEFLLDLTNGGVTIRKGAYNLALDRFTDLIVAVVPIEARTQRRRRRGVGI